MFYLLSLSLSLSFVLFNDAWSQKDIRRQIRQLYSHQVIHYMNYLLIEKLSSSLENLFQRKRPTRCEDVM